MTMRPLSTAKVLITKTCKQTLDRSVLMSAYTLSKLSIIVLLLTMLRCDTDTQYTVLLTMLTAGPITFSGIVSKKYFINRHVDHCKGNAQPR